MLEQSFVIAYPAGKTQTNQIVKLFTLSFGTVILHYKSLTRAN